MPASSLTPALPAAREGGDLSGDEVRGQLERILAHRDFEASARTRDFLRFVVEETLSGRADRLKGYTIAIEVFGRTRDFDANLDPIVRIQAGRLRRALEHYYLVAGGQDPVVIGIPRGGYVPEFSRSESAANSSRAPAGPLRDPLASLPPGVAVAVLPLQELPADAENGYFAEGLREELCDELSRYQDLAVIPCRREMLPPGGAADLGELSRRLGARFVLEGSVRRGEDLVKVSAWLVDAPEGRQVWSQGYSSTPSPGHIIETQEEIARSVSAAIGSELGVISQRMAAEARKVAPADLSTYEALLRFYDYQVTLNPASGAQCALALRAAVEREPGHGPLWSALSALMIHAYLLDLPGAEDPRGPAAEYAARGATLAPRHQLTCGIQAHSLYVQGEREAFLRAMEATLELNPGSPYFLGTAGYLLILADESERGRPLLERAMARNPCHPGWWSHALLVDHYVRCDYERALQETLKPAFEVHFWGPLLRAAVLGQLGRTTQAAAAASELLALVPDFEGRARDLTHRAILSDSIVDALLAGLRKAGLRLEDDRAASDKSRTRRQARPRPGA